MCDWAEIRREYLAESDSAPLPPHIKLPSLPEVLLRFNKHAEDPDANPCELAEIIETDAGLTYELLKFVNSAAMGLGKRVPSAQVAISLLGIRRTKYLLLSAALQQSMDGREWSLLHSRNFWTSNLERAILAREVAKLLHADGDLAFAGGMLQDALLPVLTTELFDSYVEFAKPAGEQNQELTSFEREHFGWDHAQAAAQVMAAWGFPDDLVCCVLVHHRGADMLEDEQMGRSAAAAVAVSALMPDSFRQVPDGLEQLIQLEQKWPAFDLLQIARRVHEQFEELAPAADNHYPLVRRCEKLLAATLSGDEQCTQTPL